MANIEMNYYDGSTYTVLYPVAYSAQQLATARTIRTNLSSTSTASFNGTANVTPGVTGTLPVAYGGTGTTSLSSLASSLSPYLSSSSSLKSYYGTFTGTGANTDGRSGYVYYPSGFTKIVLVLFAGNYLQAIGTGVQSLSIGAYLASTSSNPTVFQGSNGIFNNQFVWRSSYCQVGAKNSSSAITLGQPWDSSGTTYYYTFIYY